MKKWIVIFSLLLIGACEKQQHQTPIQVADDFVKHFYISDSYDIADINKYMTPEYNEKQNSLSNDHSKIHEDYIKDMIDEIRRVLKENENDYEIVKKEKLTEKELTTTIIYDGIGDIFILKTKEKVLLVLIIENSKIYSFCPDMYLSSKGKMMPYFFFDEKKLIQEQLFT